MQIEEYRKTIEACRFCPMCKVVCTVGNVTKNEANYPRGKVLTLFTIFKGMREIDENVVERIYQCSVCGRCKSWCISDYDIPGLIIAARADAVNSGKFHPKALEVCENIKNTGNPYGLNQKNQRTDIQGRKEKATDILYFAGDVLSSSPEIVESTVRILKYADIDFAVLPQEKGYVGLLYQLGFHKEAQALAKYNAEIIVKMGYKVIVISDPGEYLAFKEYYPKLGVDLGSNIKIFHISEYIKSLLERGRIVFSKEVRRSVTYHDPYSLGRYLGIYEAPREIIKAIPGVTFKELHWNKDMSRCCGAGGGLLFTNADIAKEAAMRVINEALEVGAETIITSSSFCKKSLIAAKTALNNKDIEIYDVTEFCQKAIC